MIYNEEGINILLERYQKVSLEVSTVHRIAAEMTQERLYELVGRWDEFAKENNLTNGEGMALVASVAALYVESYKKDIKDPFAGGTIQ